MKRKQEEEEEEWLTRKKETRVLSCCSYGDGGKWFRGPLIGKGSFGSVFLANLKIPKSRYSYLPEVMAVKSAEVSVSCSLQKEKEVFNNLYGCSYVLKCFGEEITTDSNGQMVFNLMLEYASGGDLASLIKKSNGRGLPESDVRRHTRSILRGLKHIHDSNYVHCDLKPENILLVSTPDSKFVAKIGDFGLTKRGKQSKKSRLDPYLRGTTVYMSPETVIDSVQEPPSDIWALGCVVLEMFTGNAPWDRKRDEVTDDVLARIAKKGAMPDIPDEIPDDGKAFLKGCFEREAKSRPTSEMLLNHPFVAGLVEDVHESDGEDACCSSPSLFEEDDYELSDVYYSDDCDSYSEEGSFDSSWSGEAEENHGLKEIAPHSSTTTPHCISTFTIPAGL